MPVKDQIDNLSKQLRSRGLSKYAEAADCRNEVSAGAWKEFDKAWNELNKSGQAQSSTL
jgi:hypothetical protein